MTITKIDWWWDATDVTATPLCHTRKLHTAHGGISRQRGNVVTAVQNADNKCEQTEWRWNVCQKKTWPLIPLFWLLQIFIKLFILLLISHLTLLRHLKVFQNKKAKIWVKKEKEKNPIKGPVHSIQFHECRHRMISRLNCVSVTDQLLLYFFN